MVEATADRGAVLGLDEVLVVPDVVTAAEQQRLREWALAQCAAGTLHQNPVDPTSRSTPFFAAADRGRSELTRGAGDGDVIWIPEATGPDQLPEEFWSVRSRVIDVLGLDLPDDPYKGSFLTCVGPGGDVHPHIDGRLPIDAEPMPLLRCNVLVQRPDAGGMPVIGGRLIDVPERGMWALHPTEVLHGATPVLGERERITLSFGFVVDPEPIWRRPLRHSPDVEAPVLDGLRSTLRAGAVAEDRMLILDSLLSRPRCTVGTVAADIGRAPRDVWQEAHQLLRMGVLRSDAPERVASAHRYTV